jgi:uncharacterized zinc-type alcohol dehydrogenase-like protein
MTTTQTIAAKGYAARDATGEMAPFTFQRRAVRAQDVQLEILHCGICHSDLHQVRNEWKDVMPAVYPCVPGHEIVGRVVKVGSGVKRFKEGDIAGVGCMVGSCRECPSCATGLENYCSRHLTLTYNAPDPVSGGVTYGGYSDTIVVDEHFALKVPKSLDPAGAAPLLCAGITTYSPLRHWKVGKGQKVGVVGLGGLGHMGIKFARAFGAHTVLFTTSARKAEDARRLGAEDVIVTTSPDAMKKHAGTFDFILDTASADHDINAYLAMLKLDGNLTLVGAPEKPLPVAAFNLIMPRKSLSGSGIGGILETQEMLDFCGEHGITADVESVPIQGVNGAFERLLRSDVKYRFVIDMASLK